jgi:hypothetical protein
MAQHPRCFCLSILGYFTELFQILQGWSIHLGTDRNHENPHLLLGRSVYDIWNSHGGEDVHVDLLRCDAMRICRWVPTFRKSILPPSWRLNMEAVCSFEMLLSAYKTTRCHNPYQHEWPAGHEKSEPTTSRLQVWRVSVTSVCWMDKTLNLICLWNIL